MTDEEFLHAYKSMGPARLAAQIGVGERRIHERRARIEARMGVSVAAQANQHRKPEITPESPIFKAKLDSGIILIGGDAHYWPGVHSTAHRAFVRWCKEFKPKIVVMNGDALDAPTISRHPPIGWEHFPTLHDELAECQERLGEIAQAARKAQKVWTLGNHDARFNTRLASVTPEFRGVSGTRLSHHFPDWEPCWSMEVNGRDGVVVKHRWKGGVHATHNNTVGSGRSIVTGHLHSQKITPYTDYNGTRWGVDAGCMAPAWGPQFNYQEANPRNHRSGFCMLTFKGGKLLPPELISVFDEEAGVVVFRGEEHSV